MLPLVGRTAQALARWLAPDELLLRLEPDLDRIDALADEREALWRRVGAADFLSDDEKRAAVGYGPAGAGKGTGQGLGSGLGAGDAVSAKYLPDQPRVPAGSPDGGQWTGEGGVSGGGAGTDVLAWGENLSSQAARWADKVLADRCEVQYERDTFHCRMVGLNSCYRQAAARYAACRKGQPITLLNY